MAIGDKIKLFLANKAMNLTEAEQDIAWTNIGGARHLLENAVLYTAQSLTAAQQTAARGNIDAAPSGFGLGGNSKLLTSDDDVNLIGASGWYSWVSDSVPANALAVTNTTTMRVDAYTSGVKVQTLYGATDGSDFITQPIVARRMIYGSKIGTWEYVNPPVYLGIEYRTTERYLGKPVYVKLVNFGSFPNNSSKSVDWANAGYVHTVISASLSSVNGDLIGGATVSGVEFTVTKTQLVVKTTADYSSNTGRFIVKYIKTTD